MFSFTRSRSRLRVENSRSRPKTGRLRNPALDHQDGPIHSQSGYIFMQRYSRYKLIKKKNWQFLCNITYYKTKVMITCILKPLQSINLLSKSNYTSVFTYANYLKGSCLSAGPLWRTLPLRTASGYHGESSSNKGRDVNPTVQSPQ